MTDVLDIDDLSISTSDGQEIARCAQLSAGRGRVIGLVGPSGSGKTTLLRGFAGALPVGCPGPGGRARVLGEEVLALGPERLRQFRRDHVAFVGQDPGSRLNPRKGLRWATMVSVVMLTTAGPTFCTARTVGVEREKRT